MATAIVYLIFMVALTSSQEAKVLPNISPPRESYNILMLLPLSGRSHRTLFLTLAETLAERGHKIELVVNHPPKSTHPNIREIYHGLPHFKEEKHHMFNARDHPWEVFELLMEGLPEMTRQLYSLPVVKDLYRRRKEFDLVFIDNFYNQMMFPFAHELPLVMVVASGVDPIQSAIVGNVVNPSYNPAMQVLFPQPMALWQRTINTAMHVIAGLIKQYLILSKIQAEISVLFPDVPLLHEIEKNQSLVLLNYCNSFDITLPLLPSQIDIGTLHCNPGQPLSKDLEEWLNAAGEAGVVYFSLGTVARGTTIPSQWRQLFVRAFAKLKQRVIWKYEDKLPEISDNVLVKKWLPQQDLLAHPQVKLFISHAGMLSIQEAVYHATPVLAMPIFADQPRNAQVIQGAELGIVLNWEDLTEDLLVDTINTIVDSEVYRDNMKRVAKVVRDQPQSPRDRAAFWTEYVIRHRGAPQLRTPAAELSWVEFLLLDVAAVFCVLISLCFLVFCGILRCIFKRFRGKKMKTFKKE